MFRIDSWDFDDGLKLMEHSYLENTYVNFVVGLLENNPSNLIWLCDYANGHINWKNVDEVKTTEFGKLKTFTDGYLINHSKNEYVDLATYKLQMDTGDWIVHPLPILTNSETDTQGGGDLHTIVKYRNRWSNNLIEYSSTVDESYTDITEELKDCKEE